MSNRKASNQKFCKLLLDCQKNGDLIDFKTYEDPEITETGFVEKISDSLVCFSVIKDNGDFKGFSVFYISRIYFLRTGSNVLRKISKKFKKEVAVPRLKDLNLSTLNNSLKTINKLYGYVVVHVEEIDPEVCYIGEVKDVDDYYLYLNAFGPRNNPGRHTEVLGTPDVTRIDFEGKYEKDLFKDYKNKVINLR